MQHYTHILGNTISRILDFQRIVSLIIHFEMKDNQQHKNIIEQNHGTVTYFL